MDDYQKIEAAVLAEFYQLCRIPRPSGREERVGRFLSGELTAMGFSPRTDAAGNVLCDIPGTNGLETRPRLALQAHMDMVCVGAPDYRPEQDPVIPVLDGEFLRSDGRSTLGADCGIGIAVLMYLLRSESPHVPLRVLFTTQEERGLVGARCLRSDCLSGCAGLINLDGFHFGRLLISSAGGLRQTFQKSPDCFPPMLDAPVCLKITGLKGGHSGDDIHLGRANAGRLLVWLLDALEIPYELGRVEAGTSHNAIPAAARALIVTDSRDGDNLSATLELFLRGCRELYPAEPELQITLEKAAMPERVLTADERDNFLALAGLIPWGVQEPHPLFPEIVGTSCNPGVLAAGPEGLTICSFLRSCREEALDTQGAFLKTAAEGFGYGARESRYPAWPGTAKDALTDCFLAEGAALEIPLTRTAVHVGLETSILHALAPEMPMVSIGMDILDAHSPQERVRRATIAPFTRLLAGTLCRWGQ